MTTGKTINRAYEAQVKAILSGLMGRDFIELVPNPSYPDSIVYTGIGRKQSLVFKMVDPTGRDEDRITAEAWALTKAQSVGVPTPTVVEVDASKSKLPSTYVVMEQAEGSDLRTPQLSDDEMRPYLLKIGRMMKKLHSANVEGYGFLVTDQSGTTSGMANSWHVGACHAVEDGLRILVDHELITRNHASLAEKILEKKSHILEKNYNSLLHGDLGMIHVFANLETQQLTGLIDFGECKSGDPVWDFVDFRQRYIPTIIEGYEPDAEMKETLPDRMALYGILRNMIWAVRWHDVWPDSVGDVIRYYINHAAEHFSIQLN